MTGNYLFHEFLDRLAQISASLGSVLYILHSNIFKPALVRINFHCDFMSGCLGDFDNLITTKPQGIAFRNTRLFRSGSFDIPAHVTNKHLSGRCFKQVIQLPGWMANQDVARSGLNPSCWWLVRPVNAPWPLELMDFCWAKTCSNPCLKYAAVLSPVPFRFVG